MLNQNIFKAYDVRGIYPSEIDEKTAKILGQAYAGLIHPKRIVVGRDMRIASPALTESFIEGVHSYGVNVDYIGEMPVDAMSFAFSKYGYGGGVYCTASHNPKEYHGFKLLKKGGLPVTGKDLWSAVKIVSATSSAVAGNMRERDVTNEFIQHLLSFVDPTKIRKFKVVVDAGNGMAGKIIPLLEKHLPMEILPLFFELDGNFPNHPSNVLDPLSHEAIGKKIRETGADCGALFDGDTDRVLFFDETGKPVQPDITLLILARYFLSRHIGESIVYNLLCTKAISELVSQWGGKTFRCNVGWVNVKETMMRHKAVVGGEISAHYNFRDNFYSDSGFIAFLVMLEYLSLDSRRFSEIARELTMYARSDEMNFRIENIPAKIEAIQKKYRDGKHDFSDGITVMYNDFWFNVRPSNTEPLLRLMIEADNKALLEEKKEELVKFLQNT